MESKTWQYKLMINFAFHFSVRDVVGKFDGRGENLFGTLAKITITYRKYAQRWTGLKCRYRFFR